MANIFNNSDSVALLVDSENPNESHQLNKNISTNFKPVKIEEVHYTKDERKYPRRNLVTKAGVLLNGKYIICKVSSVSEGGVFILTELELENGRELLLNFFLDNENIIIAKIQILSFRESTLGKGYGAQFTAIELTQKRWIRAFISLKTQKESLDPQN